MERESFEDSGVAELLNRHFVAVKVDREERPDIDQIYMTVCQTMTGQGGWPLTVFLTPDKKPFFAGTYFPKKSGMGQPGLIDLLQQIADAWENRKKELTSVGEKMSEHLRQQYLAGRAGSIDFTLAEQAFQIFVKNYDGKYGGFGTAPKFPTPHNLIFLLRYWHKTGEEKALRMAEETLLAMAKGGIYDQIGFGFARYATDRKWLAPHFEKMLYDNALLAYAYVEGFQATGNKLLKVMAEEIFEYLFREMASPEGGFYAAQDADSEGEEGRYYLWDYREIMELLGEELGKKFAAAFDITPGGNFEGHNIPNLLAAWQNDLLTVKKQFAEARLKLLDEREKRVHPFKDDKQLTGWNGLLMAALAKGAAALGRDDYARAAAGIADFIDEKLSDDEGRILARYREGQADFPGYLDDYAFMVWGLLELYRVDFKEQYLLKAMQLTNSMLELFWDEKNGGFFLSGKDGEMLLARPKEIYDGAIPSGNSVAALNLVRLARLTGDVRFERYAKKVMQTFAGQVSGYPAGYSFYLLALQALEVSGETVIVGDRGEGDTAAMLRCFRENYLPFTEMLFKEENGKLAEELDFLKEYRQKRGKATAYVCRNFTCEEPVNDPAVLQQLLSEK